jgi:hypothetical protein
LLKNERPASWFRKLLRGPFGTRHKVRQYGHGELLRQLQFEASCKDACRCPEPRLGFVRQAGVLRPEASIAEPGVFTATKANRSGTRARFASFKSNDFRSDFNRE